MKHGVARRVVLDTNVLSELLRAQPDAAVHAWVAALPVEHLFVSVVTQAEMELGARLLPVGQRRRALEAALRAMFEQDFAGRVLPFDGVAATHYVDVVAHRRAIGRPVTQFDAQIAATALAHGCALATRNRADFEDCGLELIDPWRRDAAP